MEMGRMNIKADLGKIDGLDEYIEKQLAEKDRIIGEQQAIIQQLKEENENLSKEHQEMLEKYILLRLKIGEVLNDE